MRIPPPQIAAASLFFVAAASASPPGAPFVPDEHTLLLAHFDDTMNAAHALGFARAEGRAARPAAGRFGGGLELPEHASLAFPGADNFPGAEGTVEFWIQPSWSGDDGRDRRVFAASGGPSNYLNINKLAKGTFGAGISGIPSGGGAFVYKRADRRISEWKPGDWHHVAVCWENGRLSLWLDGECAATCEGALPPQVPPREIALTGSGHVLDDLCISRIARYRSAAAGAPAATRVEGKPVPPRVELAQRWTFNEPPCAYRCALPAGAAPNGGLLLVPKNYLDDTDPDRLPEASPTPSIDIFASPGEVEPASFLIVAPRAASAVAIAIPDLNGPAGAIPAANHTSRRVVRTPMRKIYTAPSTETEVVNRFLPRWTAVDIPAGEFREAWIEFRVPPDTAPGLYEGSLSVRHAHGAAELPVRIEVLPVRLVEHPVKKLASYYRMGAHALDPARIGRELRDMRDHGLRNLFPHFGIEYRRDGNEVVPDTAALDEGMRHCRNAGFTNGTIIVESGLPALARLLGHDDLGKDGDGASLDGDTAFQSAARRGLDAFLEFRRRNPGHRFYITHLDEVFGSRPLLDQYIRLSKAVRQIPEIPLYITFNTRDEKADALRRDLDPFVDLRCHHGYTFEMWLARGHTVAEYQAELNQSGDAAWFYHNARGTYWTPEWSRIINGLYLWASPFTTHCPWTYQAYSDNPFDDTDGPETKGHDWGLSFPGNDDPADLVPTRCYEAMREGADDLRYFATLEAAIARAPASKAAQAAAARACLEKWRQLILAWRFVPPSQAIARPSDRGAGAVDADTGWIMGKGTTGTAAESPLIHSLASSRSGADWQTMRREIAEQITGLAKPRN